MGNFFGAEPDSDEEKKDRLALAHSPPRSRHELKQIVAKEMQGTCRRIESVFEAYLEKRDSRFQENQNWKKEYDQLQTAFQKFIQQQEAQRRHLTDNIQYYHGLEAQLQQKEERIRELLTTLEAKDEEILKLKEHIDPTREMRRKGLCIRPGDITHEDVAKRFKELYTNRNLLKPLGITQTDDRAQYFTKLLRCAYDCCKTSVLKMAEEELVKLFETPQHIYSEEERACSDLVSPWKSRQEALSLLLSSKASLTLPPHLIDEVIKKQREVADMKDVVSEVTTLAWDMVTRSPPITIGTPPVSHDMYEVTDLNGVLKDGASPGSYTYQHRRPVLFFGPLGTVGEKGSALLISPNELNLEGPD